MLLRDHPRLLEVAVHPDGPAAPVGPDTVVDQVTQLAAWLDTHPEAVEVACALAVTWTGTCPDLLTAAQACTPTWAGAGG